MIDAFRRASAGRVTAVMPYYGYVRQDRKSKARDPITAKLVADLIDKAGAWYTYGDVRVQGRDSMKEYLREHPDVSDQIEAEIRANAHKLMSPQARKAAIASGRAVEVAADDFLG